MRTTPSTSSSRLASLAAVSLALIAFGCEGGRNYSSSTSYDSTPAKASVSIQSPGENAIVAGHGVTVRVRTTGFRLTAPGYYNYDGEGHARVYIDKPASSGNAYDALIDSGDSVSVHATLAPGAHYLIVALHKNDKSAVGATDSVAFTVPAPAPAPTPAVEPAPKTEDPYYY